MSATGGNGAQELIDAIRSLAREFSAAGADARANRSALGAFSPGNVGAAAGQALGGPAGGVVGEALGNNFFVNNALKMGADFSKDVAAGVANDAFKYGGGFNLSSSIESQALRAGAALPFVGDAINLAQGPLVAAENRTKGMFAAAVRGGATVSDEVIDTTLSFTAKEESRAALFGNRVDQRATMGESGDRLRAQVTADAGSAYEKGADAAKEAGTDVAAHALTLAFGPLVEAANELRHVFHTLRDAAGGGHR